MAALGQSQGSSVRGVVKGARCTGRGAGLSCGLLTSCRWDPGLACGRGTRVGRAAAVRVGARLSLQRDGAASLLSVSFVEAVPHCVVLAGLQCVLFVRGFISVRLFCIIWDTLPLHLLSRYTAKRTRSQPFTTFKSKKLTFSRNSKFLEKGCLLV